MARQSRAQKETVGRVMHEFRHGELESGSGRRVRNPKQAIAIALHEAGASRTQDKGEQRQALSRTKQREHTGRTAQAEKEGRGQGPTRKELYAQAAERGVPGRSRMSKDELARAVRGAGR